MKRLKDLFQNIINKIDRIGTKITNEQASISISSGSWTTLNTFTVTPGVWLICAVIYYPSNATGYRRMILTSSSSATSANAIWTDNQTAVSGQATITKLVGHTSKYTSNQTLYIRGYQTSGSTLTVNCNVYAMRII